MMTSKLTQEELDVLRAVPIRDILGLSKNTKTVATKCPFHLDTHPSLFFYDDGSYHCFGCGKHGHNSIDFIMDCGYSFEEALDELSKYL